MSRRFRGSASIVGLGVLLWWATPAAAGVIGEGTIAGTDTSSEYICPTGTAGTNDCFGTLTFDDFFPSDPGRNQRRNVRVSRVQIFNSTVVQSANIDSHRLASLDQAFVRQVQNGDHDAGSVVLIGLQHARDACGAGNGRGAGSGCCPSKLPARASRKA